MTPAVILAWAQVAQILIGAGIAGWTELRTFIEGSTGTPMTADQVSAILTAVLNDANVRLALAQVNAGITPTPAVTARAPIAGNSTI